MRQHSKIVLAIAVSCLLPLMIADPAKSSDSPNHDVSANMVAVKGGTFEMGDVFGEGRENEGPVHQVTLSSFFISKYEVTVGQYREFVEQTVYKTSAEAPDDADARAKVMAKFASGGLTREQVQDLKNRMLEYSGAGYWHAEKRAWVGYNPQTNWKNPGVRQSDDDPVLAVSADDAMHYCNWLSKKAGLPVAYNPETGDILDKDGNPTGDITTVKGYRLPTEAEWEYASREGGRKVRFGNGKNIAKSSEINFRADDSEYEYLELGQYLKGTSPVGSYPPNGLGLYDMSGNAWEWVSDKFATYTDEARTNPYCTDGEGHALRGGRWGGDASEARVSSRSPWPRNDRCNNSGFRIARSAN